MVNLLLVYPQIESSNTNTSTYSVPLGLGSIGTYCRNNIDNLEVRILDGSLITHQEQLAETKRFGPDIIGINPTIASQANGYDIARKAKELGSLVVFGGVNSTNLWQSMLQNRKFIDGVVLYDGEIPMLSIIESFLKNDSLEGIPNLAHRDHDGNIHAPSLIYIPRLGDLPDVDYSLFELGRFFEQTQRKGFGKAVTYYAGKGCSKRGGANQKVAYSLEEYNRLITGMDICTFCGRNDLGSRNLPEDREAGIVGELYDKFGVRGFFNVQDTVNLRNKTPIGLDGSWFRLFIGIESVTPENIGRLKQRYGPNIIFQAGIEAASPQMRKAYGKKEIGPKGIMSKVELMREEGIQLHASFILGGRGETEESMRKTTEVARRLADYENVTWILISPQLILPGSPDFKALLQMPAMHNKYAENDSIDIAEINQDFLSWFAPGLTRERILEEIKQTFNDISKKGNDVVLDVKGVVQKEEQEINPNRPYCGG